MGRTLVPRLAVSLLALATAPASADALAPYRALAADSTAARLLAFARAGMRAEWSGAAVDERGVPDWPAAPVGLYLSLVDGRRTRACVGSDTPVGSLAGTVRWLAHQVLAADRRHPPLRREELDGLRVVLSFAGDGEPLADPMQADPGREGLLVASPRGAIAFLPGEARTVAWALREARRAGVLAGALSNATYRRFPVVVIGEPSAPASAQEGSDVAP